MKLVPCTEELLRAVDLRPDLAELDERNDFFEVAQGLMDTTVFLAHWARSIVDEDGKALGALGVNLCAEGIGDCWAYLSPQVLTHPFGLSKMGFQAIAYATDELKLWRLQAVIDVSHPERLRWAKHLGFEIEGVVRKHLLQRDHWIVGRITA